MYRKPLPSSPIRFSAGISRLSKNSSLVSWLTMLAIGRTVRPWPIGVAQVDDEDRHALGLLLHLGERRRAREQDHQVGVLDARDPDLLAVDDVAVALLHGGGLDLRRVGAGGRLGHAPSTAGAARRAAIAGQVLAASAPRCRGAAACPCCTSGRGTAPELPPQRLISSMITDASVSPSPEPPYSSGISAASQPALGQRVDERLGIARAARRPCGSTRRGTARRARESRRGCPGAGRVRCTTKSCGSRSSVRRSDSATRASPLRPSRVRRPRWRPQRHAARHRPRPPVDRERRNVEQRAHGAERKARDGRASGRSRRSRSSSSVAISGPCTTRPGIALHLGDVAAVVMDPVAVERQRRIAEQQHVVGIGSCAPTPRRRRALAAWPARSPGARHRRGRRCRAPR